jgi:hypothetical protein
MMLQIPEIQELYTFAKLAHYKLGPGSAGATQRRMSTAYWHPELVLTVQQVLAECPQCQLMKKSDPALPNLNPILLPTPLTRWAIDHIFWKSKVILVMVEYSTFWVEAEFVPGMDWAYTFPMLTKVQNRFGSFYELVSDNANEFSESAAKEWHKQYNTKVLPIIPYRPRGNGMMEQINGEVKGTITKTHIAHPTILLQNLLQMAVNMHNRTPRPSGYSSYFLMYGTIFPDRLIP